MKLVKYEFTERQSDLVLSACQVRATDREDAGDKALAKEYRDIFMAMIDQLVRSLKRRK